jgi:hypothetical protein
MPARVRRSRRANRDTDTYAHKRARRAWLAKVAANPGGICCVRCGRPLYPGMLVDLDHTDDRRGYLGLSCRSCNRRDGQRKTTAILKAKGWQPTARQLAAIRAKAWRQAGAATPANRRQPPRW